MFAFAFEFALSDLTCMTLHDIPHPPDLLPGEGVEWHARGTPAWPQWGCGEDVKEPVAQVKGHAAQGVDAELQDPGPHSRLRRISGLHIG